jgi:outer membrane lipoprotein LolB
VKARPGAAQAVSGLVREPGSATRRSTIIGLLAGAVGATLTACATPPLLPEDPPTAGRLALRIDATPGRPAQSLSVAFELRGNAGRGQMVLISPIGTQLALARWAPGKASLDSGDGPRGFSSLEALAEAAFGEALPLAAWPDWLAGRPWPAAAHRPIDGGFEQLGWQVETAALAEGLLQARRDTPPRVNLRVRLDNAAP